MRNPVNAQSNYSVARTVADLFLFSARVFLFTSIKSRTQRGISHPKSKNPLTNFLAVLQYPKKNKGEAYYAGVRNTGDKDSEVFE